MAQWGTTIIFSICSLKFTASEEYSACLIAEKNKAASGQEPVLKINMETGYLKTNFQRGSISTKFLFKESRHLDNKLIKHSSSQFNHIDNGL